jgi:3'(2'), 5'-bisphosphate nucleotidase
MFDRPETQFAINAVRLTAALVQQVQAEMVTPALTKGDRSPVTVGDFAAQALVGQLLQRNRPDDILVAEEDADMLSGDEAALGQVQHFMTQAVGVATIEDVLSWIERGGSDPGARFWTLDPIDGTKGFLRAQQYAVALAYVVEGRVELGVLGCPNLEEGHREAIGGVGSLLVAERGHGTWVGPLAGDGEFTRLEVSKRDDPTTARVLRSVESGHTNVGQMGELVTAMGIQADPVLMDSQAKYAVLGSGAGDLLFRLISSKQPDYKEKIWDQAAGSLVVEEAGGRVSDLDGKPLDFALGRTLEENRGVVASNSSLHEAALKAIQALGA